MHVQYNMCGSFSIQFTALENLGESIDVLILHMGALFNRQIVLICISLFK